MKGLIICVILITGVLSSCCNDCGGFIPPIPAEPCKKVYKGIPLSNEAKSLLPFSATDSMVFRHRLGGLLVYRLDSIFSDSTHYGCDTLIAQENIWAKFSTQTKLPAQPILLFKLRKIDYTDAVSREIFTIETGVDFTTTVFIDNFEEINRDFKSTFHEKIINCDTAFYNVYDLSSYTIGYGGYRNIYYSKEKGVEALVGGPNSWDYFVRVY